MHELLEDLLYVLASANPVLFKQYLPKREFPSETLFVVPGKHSTIPDVREIDDLVHVIPVFIKGAAQGAVIPLIFKPSPWWRLSDAFGRFGAHGSDTPWDSFKVLLRNVDSAFIPNCTPLNPAPIILRYGFDIRIGCPIHLDRIEGCSMQFPLIMALLREVARDSNSKMLPFGNVPIFCTGVVNADGSIGPVENVCEKAAGFVRECGKGLPALLPGSLVEDLCRRESLGLFEPLISVSHIGDLLDIVPRLHEHLTAPPHQTEMDALIHLMQAQRLFYNFENVGRLEKWMGSHSERISPSYQVRFDIAKAQLLSKCGNAVDAETILKKYERLPHGRSIRTCKDRRCGECFGAEEKVQIATRYALNTTYLCECEDALSVLERVKSIVTLTSLDTRGRFWAACGKVFYFLDRHKEAEAYLEKAIVCADCGATSQSGQHRNYLVRVLLAEARVEMDTTLRNICLGKAEILLKESAGAWAPTYGIQVERNHRTFCGFLESLLAKERGLSWLPAEELLLLPYNQANNYLLLSCARNPHNTLSQRIMAAEQLTSRFHYPVAGREETKANTQVLLSCIYRLYEAGLKEEKLSVEARANLLRSQLLYFKCAGHPGWFNRLQEPLYSVFCGRRLEDIEILCDAVPFF